VEARNLDKFESAFSAMARDLDRATWPGHTVVEGQSMPLFADLEQLVRDHRPHGSLTADAPEPAWNGYLLTVACPCGMVS
jgi:hypothetical protein